MRLFTFKVPDDFNLFLQGDAHKYTQAHSADGYKLLFDSVNSEFEGVAANKNYVIDFGDFADLIPTHHKYYDSKVHKLAPLEQIERLVEEYAPIAHALLFMLDSTHSEFLKEIGNVTEFVCHQLEQKYKPYRRDGLFATFTAKADFRSIDNTRIFKLYATHGSRGIWSRAGHRLRRTTNKTMALIEYLKEQASDCAIMARAHTHQLIVQEPIPVLCMVDDSKNLHSYYLEPTDYHTLDYIPEEMRWYISTGGFLRTQILGASTYGEKREYNPMDLGFVVCMIRNRAIAGVKKMVL